MIIMCAMKMIRNNSFSAVVLFIVLSMASVLQAAYAPQVDMETCPKDEVRKGVAALRGLSVTGRQACIAERLGLLFSLADASAYAGSPKYQDNDRVHFYEVIPAARFVGSNGKVYNFYGEMHAAWEKKSKTKNGYDLWVASKRAIGMVGDEALFISFASEITKMVQQMAKYHLKAMPQQLREAWLAEYGRLLYLPDGGEAYGEPSKKERRGTFHLQHKIVDLSPKDDAVFTDSQGRQLQFKQVLAEHFAQQRNAWAWENMCWCAALVGEEDILRLFPKEMKQLAKMRPAKSGDEQPTGETE